jgi:hypothetical protein
MHDEHTVRRQAVDLVVLCPFRCFLLQGHLVYYESHKGSHRDALSFIFHYQYTVYETLDKGGGFSP